MMQLLADAAWFKLRSVSSCISAKVGLYDRKHHNVTIKLHKKSLSSRQTRVVQKRSLGALVSMAAVMRHQTVARNACFLASLSILLAKTVPF
jgi:CO/xanthine dehydrogenase FAD-binding subunit